ncbi:MAG: tRNA (adenosine(37)-N6)-threonylcarbamoyltransferase complex transferase subunit TsaD, partial [Patescibacteria group bacterium]
MLILGIETSCDETAAAIVRDGTHVLSSVISSQRARFENTGGVIPEDAARQQVLCMLPVLNACLAEAKTTPEDIDAIAVTKGPGLLGSLLVGTTTSRTLATLWKKPLIGVHHTLGHLSSTWLAQDDVSQPRRGIARNAPTSGSDVASPFPILTLSASGGHTDLWLRTSHTKGRLLGSTRDDAAGEAFDKGAAQ